MDLVSRLGMVRGGTSLEGLKVVFLFGSLDLGGAERQGLIVADFLKRIHGAEVEIWGLNEKPGRLAELCDRHAIPWRGIAFHWGVRRGVSHFFRFISIMRSKRPDVLVSATCVPNLVCALVWKLSGARLCVWNQVDEGLLLGKGVLHRTAVRLPSCFISNSTGGRDFLVRTYGLAPESIQVIHNGIAVPEPLVDRDAWRKRLGLSPGAPAACMVANLSRYKDHETLLRAWAEVSRGHGNGRAELLLAGRFDGAEAILQPLCEELGIADRVRFLGKVDDVDGLLAAVDLFVYSSRSEGIPNAILEAMVAGLPVAATDIPGIREAVGPEGNRFLAPAGDVAALAERIGCLLNDAELRVRVGERLRQRAVNEFSLARMCRETAEVFQAALDAGNR